jgi:hypothetical protein
MRTLDIQRSLAAPVSKRFAASESDNEWKAGFFVIL